MRAQALLAAMAAALTIATGPAPAQPPAPAAQDAHLLVATRGAVLLHRAGWTMNAPTGPGAALRRGDLVSVPVGGLATVACADLTLRELPPGRFSGLPCAVPDKTALLFEGSLIAATRGDDSDELPFVVAPRRTRLLSPRPVLRWSVPNGAGSVTVTVKGPGVSWSANAPAGSTSLTYPADAPALQPGGSYRVSIAAAGRSSDEAADAGMGFTLLTELAAAEVRAGLDRINALKLAPDAARLLAAHFLATKGLAAEAIEQLAAAALEQSVGLPRLAEAQWLQAAKAAASANDIEVQAQAQAALGGLYLDVFGLRSDAAKSFDEAAALYAKLGDNASAAQARDKATHAKAP
ncbi:MAG: hypothetical protein JF607_20055 [Burkholderiales bacterium]|nr:hypothetical protein [Burkholderiales bacterium]